MSKQLEAKPSAELAAAEAELLADVRGDLDRETISVPLLVVVQGTTRNPPEDSRPGDFYNIVTGESFGSSVEFIVSRFNRGRFYVDRETHQAYIAGAEDVVPQSWPPEYAGRVFSELPEAEETFKARVNDGEVEWGRGPAISTTFNFTGYAVGSEIPVRLSLQRTAVPTARKIITLIKAARAPWDQVINLTTERKVDGDKTYFVPRAARGRAVTTEERSAAVALATQLRGVAVVEVGHDADAPPKPEGEATGLQDSI